MKIKVNYDLLTKISEAENGYCLKKCANKILGFTAVSTPLSLLMNPNNSSLTTLTTILCCLGIHSFYTATQVLLLKGLNKEISQSKLFDLVDRLNKTGVKVDIESIMNSYEYAKEYSIQSEGYTIPMIEQKKYIKIPVSTDAWGNREIPIVQEHLIGTNEYNLSLGLYREKKYSLGIKTMLGK